jgi:hypothetical protein
VFFVVEREPMLPGVIEFFPENVGVGDAVGGLSFNLQRGDDVDWFVGEKDFPTAAA